MRKAWTIVSPAAVLGVSLATGFALQAQPTMSTEMNIVLQAYLFEDCGTGEDDPTASLQAVAALGREVIPFLLRAVADGPLPELVADLDEDARADFERRRQFLEEEDGLSGLMEQEVRSRALEQTEAEYVKLRVQSFDSSYRQRALNALVILGPEGVVEDLRAIADTTAEPDLRGWMEEAVRKLSSEPSQGQ